MATYTIVMDKINGIDSILYALGRQSSLGGVIPVVHHTGMAYLFNYTEQHTKHKRGK